MVAYLAAVDSNGVCQQVFREVERFRIRQETYMTPAATHCMLTLYMEVNLRDAEYIVEYYRILLQQEKISERTKLCFCSNDISDEAIDVFCGFLRDPPC
jgi:hypothetical protein